MAATYKTARKEVKKIEKHQRKHGEKSEMTPSSKFYSRVEPGKKLKANLMKEGVKAMGKHHKKAK